MRIQSAHLPGRTAQAHFVTRQISATALATAALLALRAVSCWRAHRSPSHDDPSAGPYRSGHLPANGRPIDWVAPARRYFLGATLSLYLSLWTLTWHAGPFPAHLLPLDLLFTAAAAAALWRARYFPTIAPLAGFWLERSRELTRLCSPEMLHPPAT